ncbi:MAG: methionine adenosyltransferase [Clostridia bacterium]|nr:methionine adenosyltransferase [Clostridia bacterium]MBO5298656.1 methionine adenosyltransferase [Clostridia bacterium]MBQ4628831.1 methionine adenosyltransferase [Clostridia bacterium]
MKRFFTSESVTEGHPDKICDRISDAVLDAILTQDPVARVACETCVTTGMVLIMGEITTNCYVEIPKIVRDVINGIGYDRAKYGFDGSTCSVLTSIEDQSADIALGVDRDGAGDQGMMFGFACDETNTLMPMPIYFAHELSKKLTDVRKQGTLGFLRPDGKTQVTVEYENDRPVRISEIVISAQHSPVVSYDSIREGLIEEVIKPIIPEGMTDSNTKIFVNPTGQFVVGGPQGDSGLTGRKIIVDTYGGYARHGGGAFSGKDPTKVDRSASYMTRYIAKNLVKAGIAKKCEIQVAYAIGVADPVSISVETFGTGIMSDEQVTKIVREVFDLRPRAIIEQLDLRKPIYQPLSAYGHMGREELGVKWEICDRVNDILEAAKHV